MVSSEFASLSTIQACSDHRLTYKFEITPCLYNYCSLAMEHKLSMMMMIIVCLTQLVYLDLPAQIEFNFQAGLSGKNNTTR